MAIVTIGSIKKRAAEHLGDAAQEKFTARALQGPFETAWETLYYHIRRSQLQDIEIQHPYQLPANITELLPETAGISNLQAIKYIEERPANAATSEVFVEMDRKERLTQRDPDVSRLHQYQLRNNRIYFIGCLNPVDLRINYWASAVAPQDDRDTAEFDGAQTWLAWELAAIAGPPKGHLEDGERCERRAAQALSLWLDPKVRDQQAMQVQQRPFHAGRQVPFREGRPPRYNT